MDIKKLIKEMILEMLENNDDGLIKVMMEHDKKFESITENKDEFVGDKIKLLKEELNIQDEPSEEEVVQLNEMKKILDLAGIRKLGD
jgi:hypothetical protein